MSEFPPDFGMCTNAIRGAARGMRRYCDVRFACQVPGIRDPRTGPPIKQRNFVTRIFLNLGLVFLFSSVVVVVPFAQGGQSVGGIQIGEPNVVFDWTRNRCAESDIPDTSLRLFVRDDAQIIGFATHYNARRFLISRQSEFRRDCAVVFESAADADPARFNDWIWVASTWTDDGKTVVALGHNEYHGEKHPGHCQSGLFRDCWYNAIMLLKSEDGGRTFRRLDLPPIAAPVFTYQEFQETPGIQGKPRGFFEPTNIVSMNGFYYTLIYTTGGGNQAPGTCVFRTADLLKPNAWEYWIGDSYAPSSRNPYAHENLASPPCKPIVGHPERFSSIVRHRPSGTYLATVGMQSGPYPQGVIGITTSRDLEHWTPLIPIMNAPMFWSTNCENSFRFGFPTIVDLSSSDRNFTDIGDEPYLYVTKMKVERCGGLLNRDLVRFRLRIGFNIIGGAEMLQTPGGPPPSSR